MIQLIGHNAIVAGIAHALIKEELLFQIFSNKALEGLEQYTQLVSNVEQLKIALLHAGETPLRLSAGAPWLFKPDWLEAFEPNGIFNIHGTALPQDRGGTIASWLILNQKRLGHAVIHKIVAGPDKGPILLAQEFVYPAHCHLPTDYLEVYNQFQIKAGIDCCLQWQAGKLDLTKVSAQPAYLSTYWPRLFTPLNGWVDWNWEGSEIAIFIRAFDDPYSGAMTQWRGKNIHLKKAFFQPDMQSHPFQWGVVFRVRQTEYARYLAVAVQGGSLYIQEARDEEGNDLLDTLKVGDRLQTSTTQLEQAKRRTMRSKKGFYTQKDYPS